MCTPRSRRTRHEEHEEHENHERWLVTYADMLTLLMVLFIVMFAMSQVDQKKYNALKNGLADGFGADELGPDRAPTRSCEERGSPSRSSPSATPRLPEMPAPRQQAVAAGARQPEARTEQRDVRRGRGRGRPARGGRARSSLAALREQGPRATTSRRPSTSAASSVSLVSRHVVFRAERRRAEPARPAGRRHARAGARATSPNELRIDGHTNQAAGASRSTTRPTGTSRPRAR